MYLIGGYFFKNNKNFNVRVNIIEEEEGIVLC